jgi:hypothetical protein
VGQPKEPQITPVMKPASLSVLGSADQGRCEVGVPSQVAPAMALGSRDHPGDFGLLGVGHSEET